MDYIPKTNNFVINPINDKERRWIPFTEDMLREIINEKKSDDEISKMFPAQTFFGFFCGESSIEEIKGAIDVLKAILTIHNFLNRETSIMSISPEELADEKVFLKLESIAEILISCLFDELKNYSNFELKEGECKKGHVQNLYTLTIPLSESYKEWIRPRVKSYSSIGEITNVMSYAFLNMGYSANFHSRKDGPVFQFKLFGRESFNECWDGVFELLSKFENSGFSYIEKYLGLMALADFISSIHLMTSNIQVRSMHMMRPTSGDLLTDFWFNCYDDSSDSDVIVKNCEVCGGLFITSSKTQRGHERCMNRKRVMESRARNYLKLRADGKTEKEAAKIASISHNTAKSILEKKYGNKRNCS